MQFGPLGVNWSQIKKATFSLLKLVSRDNRKKWLKYSTRVLYGFNISFFRIVNNNKIRDFAILLTENVL